MKYLKYKGLMSCVLKKSKEYSKLESALKKTEKINKILNETKSNDRALELSEYIFSDDENSLKISLPTSDSDDDNDNTIVEAK
jgi:hypothetical protein